MKFLFRLVAVLLLGFSTSAWAISSAAPLGFELGVATLSQVQQGLSAKTRLIEAGTNKYAGGKMLSSTGTGLDVDGLKEILFVFDQNNVLSGVLMTLSKGGGNNEGFKNLSKTLASKYKQVEKREPFVGDCYARYVQGDSVVILNVPHMSFDIELSYLTKRLLADFNKQSVQEKSAQQKTQASKF